jgi:geranylgeranyl diphosphate synthase, type II
MQVKPAENRLLEILASNKQELDKIVLDFLPRNSDSPEIKSLYDMMRDYPGRGGKGLRGTMCLLWCEMFRGKRESALITAASLELFQNWILIHDDIEDQSDLRRGQPALHKKYGTELAINAGDALHGKMWELLLSNKNSLGEDLTLRILSEFSQMLNETTEGQQMELMWTTKNDWNISERDYLLMVTKKAAWYTCITPCRLGVLVSTSSHANHDAKKTSEVLEKIVAFGINLGIAFQIVDDVLNLTADESKYGKEILGDLFEGKRTLMLIHLLVSIDRGARENIIEILSKPRNQKTNSEIQFVFNEMRKSGSIDYAKRVAKRHASEALAQFEQILEECGNTDPSKTKLTRSLIKYVSSRDY